MHLIGWSKKIWYRSIRVYWWQRWITQTSLSNQIIEYYKFQIMTGKYGRLSRDDSGLGVIENLGI